MAGEVELIEPDFWAGRGRYAKTNMLRALRASREARVGLDMPGPGEPEPKESEEGDGDGKGTG